MNRNYQYFNYVCMPLFVLIALFMASGLSITILYQVFVTSNWNYHSPPSTPLSWTSLIR
jgi:hypothetical protein